MDSGQSQLTARLDRGTAQGQMAFWDATLGKWTSTDETQLAWNSTTGFQELDGIQFDTSFTPATHAEGLMHWNSEDGTLEVGLAGGDVKLQIGQEVMIPRGKAVGSDISNGQLVYISGASGSKPELTLAKADSSATSKSTIAMATEDIAENTNGYYTAFGDVRDVSVPTATYTDGDVLYLSAATAGGFTNVKPVQPNLVVKIGYVVRAHNTEGIIFVNINQRTNNFEHIIGMTAGSIPFANTHGFLDEDNANLHWDYTNDRIGIGTDTPTQSLDVSGYVTSTNDDGYACKNVAGGDVGILKVDVNDDTIIGRLGDTDAIRITRDDGNVGIGVDPFNSSTRLDVYKSSGYLYSAVRTASTHVTTFVNGPTTSYDHAFFWDKNNDFRFLLTDDPDGGNIIEAMRITKEARVGIGTDSPNNKIQVAGLINFDDTLSNVALGTNAIKIGTTGSYNTAVGKDALKSTTTARGNVAMGWSSLYQCTKGNENFGLGVSSLGNVVDGDYNVGIGYEAVRYTNGNGNIGIGRTALLGTSGNNFSWNVGIGNQSGYSLTTGSSNIFLGAYSGYRQTSNGNLLIIDNQLRASAAEEATNSILYGTMATTPADQDLRINAQVGINITPTAYLSLPAGTATAGTAPLKFTAGTLLTTPEQGTIEFNGSKFYITNVAHQRAIDRTSDVALSTVTVANTTTETTIWTGVMAANSLVAGNVLKFQADGIVSSDSVGDLITIRVKVGGNTVVTLTSAAKKLVDAYWHMKANATQRTIGATGSRAFHIDLVIDEVNTEVIGIGIIDTTANMDVTITVQWNNADVGDIISLYQGFMEFKN